MIETNNIIAYALNNPVMRRVCQSKTWFQVIV